MTGNQPPGEDAGRASSRREFLKATLAGAGGAAFGAGNLFGALAEQATESSEQPNILFITTDEQRYDALGCAGNAAIHTPHLDRLANEGVRFARTYCQGPLCQPSRASIITGRYVHQHGQTWNQFDMNPEWPTMMKQLQAAGYYTSKIGKTHFYSPSSRWASDLRKNAHFVRSFGLDYIFEEYDKILHLFPRITTPYKEYLKRKGLFETYVKETPPMFRPGSRVSDQYAGKTSALAQEHDLTSYIADRSIDWLKNYDGRKPFFHWLSFVAPHPPLIDDAIWAQHYRDVKVPLGPTRRPDTPNNPWGRYLRGWIRGTQVDTLTPEIVRDATRHYYGMISLIDQRIGDVVKAINERGWGRNTWIFFTSDHGDMMGDHGLMFKNVFYKGSVLVPNIIRPPKGMEPRVVEAITQSIDITATILDVAGAEPLEGASGQSLVPVMQGKGAQREAVYSELAGHNNRGNFLVMVATERYRYTYDRQNKIACELFDLHNDPDELDNLVNDPAYDGIRKDLHKDYLAPFVAT